MLSLKIVFEISDIPEVVAHGHVAVSIACEDLGMMLRSSVQRRAVRRSKIAFGANRLAYPATLCRSMEGSQPTHCFGRMSTKLQSVRYAR